jgi:AcrR family transcriptional regulator
MEQANSPLMLPRKEREKIARQQDILKAARELFLSKGYHNTTLEEIARHAEFGKGTIYNYFTSKEELFYGIIEQLANETFELIKAALATPGGAREKLTAYAKSIIMQSRSNADLFRLIFQEIHRPDNQGYKEMPSKLDARRKESLKLILKPLTEEIHAQKIRSLDPEKMVAVFDAMVRFYCIDLVKNQLQLSLDEIDADAAFIISIFFDGVAERNPKG